LLPSGADLRPVRQLPLRATQLPHHRFISQIIHDIASMVIEQSKVEALKSAPRSGTPHTRLLRGQRNIGDFSGWKDHDSYQKSFDRLMRDLRVDASGQ
jgi:hypothetical protein